MSRWNWMIALLVGASTAPGAAAALPAFPGAQGPGADATGGRGGEVYHVTSLEDDAKLPGTLRHGLTTAPASGRTIVFDVAGTIRLKPPGRPGWLVSNASNLTIAGQTAPWPGITIVGQTTKLTGRNVILRNVRFRPGKDQLRPGVATNDGISCYLQDSIIDHCSVSWADDEHISCTDDVRNTTVQYCIMAEGLNYKGHSYGSLISSDHDDARVSYHHNLYAHNKSRLPRLGSEKGTGVILNFSNNVIYDWNGKGGYSANDVNSGKPLPNRTNFIGNYYIVGPSNKAGDDSAFDGANRETEIHQRGNFRDSNRNGRLDGKEIGWELFTGTFTKIDKPFEVEAGHIQGAEAAIMQVLAQAGAFWWQRDPTDARIVQNVRNQSGKIINEVDDVGGWPEVKPVSRPADFDSDADGIPDAWEKANGLDPRIADDKGDVDRDGYTNIEEYLNEIAAFPATTALSFAGAGGRYEEPGNWSQRWQPSRFDRVVLEQAAVTVDSLGQRAGELQLKAAAALQVKQGGGLIVGHGEATAAPAALTLLSGSRLHVEISAPDQPARIRVEGSIQLGGRLEVTAAGGFKPTAGQQFEILSARSIAGSFESLSEGYAVQQQDGKVLLRAIQK